MLIAGVVLLIVASAAMWLLTASFAVPLVLALTALLGVPYWVVGIASSQGMYLSTRPEERGVAAGIFQTCRYLGAITATVLIGIFYGTRREPGQLGADGVRDAGARRGGAWWCRCCGGSGGPEVRRCRSVSR